ncbi:MAG TPA: TOMM precursor leader peptide-binding protein [Thermoanaerobaculia bacterium]|nr:TOMM precursor leader peptide-binding protein [Thermoanaerobaculia bacterium]
MLSRPEIRSCYRVEVVDENVFLLDERRSHLLSGSAFRVLTPLLDGSKTTAEIIEAVSASVSAAEVFYALGRLEDLDVLREGHAGLPQPDAAFWDSLGADAATALHRLRAARVAVTALEGVAAEPLIAALSGLGISAAGEDAGDLQVVLTSDYLQEGLADINQRQLQEGRAWLLAKPVGSILWIGPLLDPGRTGCWECLAQRLRSNRNVESFVQARKGPSRALLDPAPALPSTQLAAAGFLATAVAQWLAQAPGFSLAGTLVTVDLTSFATERHTLVRRPQCPVCGEGAAWALRTPEALRLESRRKIFTADGGHRALPPEETLRRFEHHVSRLLGVVSHLRRSPGTDGRIAPLYLARQDAAALDDTVFHIRSSFRGRCGGKGKTDLQARASALCESIERYSGVFQGDEIRIRARFPSLAEAIHPNVCMGYSEAQYARRREWNGNHGKRFQRVPVPFDEQAEIEWTPLWSLTEGKLKYLPTAYCYFGYPLPEEERFCWADSNGNAAGNSIEEAILQGFLELVERDSVALWWYNRISRPAVDLDAFDEPYFRELRSFYRSLQRELWVLDLTSDLEIPVFAAITRRTDGLPEDITLGFGAHLEPRIGILRAMTEANQFLPVVLPRHADPAAPYGSADEEALAWLRGSTLENRSFLAPAPGASRRAGDYPLLHHPDLRDDVEACVRTAARHGLETLVLNQTRPDVGLSVVKVVVPGLRHFWARLAPGRLYDAPVALGWLPQSLDERDLNPIPIFF